MSFYSFSFFKLSPGGNPTILVDDESIAALPDAERAAIAAALMHPDHLHADQVGFLSFRPDMHMGKSIPHMEMMGGEFCVNAVRSAAAVLARKDMLRPSAPGKWEGTLSSSGVDAPVAVSVREISPGILYETALALPRPARESVRAGKTGEILVRLPGITHLLLNAAATGAANRAFPADPLEEAQKKRQEYGLEKEEAAGVIWYAQHGETWKILPVVHVAATKSSVIESACGSASLALALALAPGKGVSVLQPSGHSLFVRFENETAWISGIVLFTAEGQARVMTGE